MIRHFKRGKFLMEFMLILFLILSTSFNIASAKIHPDAGKTSAAFLKIPLGTRASSMGGGYGAVIGDTFCLFYNPAGMAAIEKKTLAFMHNIHFEDIKQYVFVYGFQPDLRYDNKDFISFSFNYLTYGYFERRSGLYEAEPSNPSPVEGGFKAKDLAFTVNYSSIFSTSVILGGNIKYINQSIDDESASSFAFDIGGIKKIKINNSDFNIGFSVLNAGLKIKMASKSYPLPLAFKLGFSKEYKRSLFTFDILKYIDNYPFLIVGFENRITKELYLRAGYRYRIYGNELGFWSGFSSGFGFNYHDISFGYSITSYGDLGYSHKIDIKIWY
ncbi:MAG: PorV/PorQ family protein [Elusimicrobiales bacterium]